MKAALIGAAVAVVCAQGAVAAEPAAGEPPAAYKDMVARHARANGIPESLLHRIIMRESRYNPRARHRSYYGMMQIMPATAKAMGYRGSPEGLLDAETNLTYATRYLAGAFKVAGGHEGRAVGFYARGYYYDAKRMGILADVGLGKNGGKFAPVAPPDPASQRVEVAMNVVGAPTQSAAAPVLPATPVAAVPLPPMRGPVPAVVAMTAQTGAVAAVAPSASAQPQALAAAAIPLPPVRDPQPAAQTVVAEAPAPQPRSFLFARPAPKATETAIAPEPAVVDPAPAVALAAAVPLPPRREVPPAASPAAEGVEVARATSEPRKPRTISISSEPALASAGPIVPSRPRAPTPPAAPLAYVGVQTTPASVVPTPVARSEATGSITPRGFR